MNQPVEYILQTRVFMRHLEEKSNTIS